MERVFAITAVAVLAFAASAEEQRQLGAHEHGHGHLNIAIEAKSVAFELEVPGMDIVGFEHEPSTPEQRAAVAQAKATLAGGLALFKVPQAAGCSLNRVKVTANEHDRDDLKPGPQPAAPAPSADEHSEFHAQYSLDCRTLSKLTAIEFPYFTAFPNTQELEVNIITPKGQNSYKVSREKPTLELTGMI
jgi:hypothetical protein